jgi:hypothetical protein
LASPAGEGVMLLKRFVPQSTRLLADGRSVTVKGYSRAGDAARATPTPSAPRRSTTRCCARRPHCSSGRLVWIPPHREREIAAEQQLAAATEMRRIAEAARVEAYALAGQVEALALFSGAVLGLLTDPSGDSNGDGLAVMRFACLFGLAESGEKPHSVSLTALGALAMNSAASFEHSGNQ